MWFVNKAGIGDEMDLTAVVREYRRTYPDEKIQVDTPRVTDTFKYNPHLIGGTSDKRPTVHLNQIYRPHEEIGNIAVSYGIQAGVQMWDPTPELFFTQDELTTVYNDALSKLDDVHPKIGIDVWAKWPSRRWALGRFHDVARRCLDHRYQVVEFGKTDYDDLGNCLYTSPSDPRLPSTISLFDKLTLRKTMAAMAHMDLFIGNDSGLMHIAAACKVPQVIIFGPKPWYARGFPNTYPVYAMQRCPHTCNHICNQLNHPCMAPVTVDQVWFAIQKAMTLYKKGPPNVV
jgi:ADP-heptose:LPS heptosyltransferase